MTVEYHGQNAIVEAENAVFSFEVSESPRDFEKKRRTQAEDSLDWSSNLHQHRIGEWAILPYGDNNDLPRVIKNTIQNNPDIPGVMTKKAGMLWGKGPQLYREKFDSDNNLVREWVDDKDVKKWMDSWGAEEYLHRGIVDYNHVQGTWTKFYVNRGNRIDRKKGKIAKLEWVNPDHARLAIQLNSKDPDPKHVAINNWNLNHIDHLIAYKVYKKFDFQDPLAAKNSILYSNMYSFCSDYYTVPDVYGSLEWIRRSTAIPLILKALSKNSINAKYHIESPQRFWDKKAKMLEQRCVDLNQPYEEQMLVDFQKAYLRKVASVLSGEINSGKFLHTVKEVFVDGSDLLEQGWSIKPIDQNIKDFVDTQLKIGERASRAAAASVQVSSSIGNVGKENSTNSGSERIYALQDYLMTVPDIPEKIITKAINYAIKANFPEKDLRVGFYRQSVQREQEKTSNDRMKSQQV